MFDFWDYTIPPNTSEADKVTYHCKLSKGILQSVYVYFAPGNHALARCRIFLGEKPIIPRSQYKYVTSDGFLIPVIDVYEDISEGLPELKWELWNLDDTHEHYALMFASWISEAEGFAERALLGRIYERIDALARTLGAPEVASYG